MAARIKEAATAALGGSEEDLRFGVERVLQDAVLEPLGIPPARYEVSTRKYGTLITGARLDALHGHVVIEYEQPHSLESRKNYDHAIQQVKEGIRRLSQGDTKDLPRYFGVVLDGFSMGFVRYRQRLNDLDVSRQPLDVNRSTVARLVEAIVGLQRKALDPTELLRDFGPDSELSQTVIKAFHDKLKGTTTGRTSILFSDWKRVFSQVCAYDPQKLRGLEEQYGLAKGKADVETLLFSLHSYFALLMKLLGAEVASLYWPIMGSYLKTLEEAYYKGPKSLREELRDLEEGGIFAKLGISNFLEGDYFAWYLDEWDVPLADSIARVVTKLSDYDPSTADLEPERIKDLFKHLYQNLVPRRIRHDLGEFYTPDWLSELVMDEAGFAAKTLDKIHDQTGDSLAPLDVRVLDPACGSGTFLTLAIKRVREYIDEHWIDKTTALRKLTSNVMGFDLNPLAVMASRTNYLISIGDLLREKGGEQIEIPVYLADSVLVERRTTVRGTSSYSLETAAGEFHIPIAVVEGGSLGKILREAEKCVRLEYSVRDFLVSLQKEVTLQENESSVLGDLYGVLLKLEQEKRNRIWVRVLKNSFAPLLAGKFDYVVGNPPWINWRHLPSDYRTSTKALWKKYGLAKQTKGKGLGKISRDIAMLFVAVSSSRYLNEFGKLSMLVPFTLFKSSAGAGFRTFLADGSGLIKIHDLVELRPFEGALNRTAIISLARGKSQFPVPCTSWSLATHLPAFDETLRNVKSMTVRHELVLEPIHGRDKPESPWLIAKSEAVQAIRKALGHSPYDAHKGVGTDLNSVYWIEVLSQQGRCLLTRNLSTIGRKTTRQVTTLVEKDLVYPLARGRDMKKWSITPSAYIVVPHDQRTGHAISGRDMKKNFPKTYEFMRNFRTEMENRPNLILQKGPFYSLYGIGKYSFEPYKVMWKYIAGKISGKAEFSVAVACKAEDPWLGTKVIIPNEKLVLIPFQCEEEAHYVAAILNSSISRLIVASYAVETEISTHVSENVAIPKFRANVGTHQELAELSKMAHDLSRKGDFKQLNVVESAIDETAAKVFGLTKYELEAVIESLEILIGHKGEAESEDERPGAAIPTDGDLPNSSLKV